MKNYWIKSQIFGIEETPLPACWEKIQNNPVFLRAPQQRPVDPKTWQNIYKSIQNMLNKTRMSQKIQKR